MVTFAVTLIAPRCYYTEWTSHAEIYLRENTHLAILSAILKTKIV